MTDLTDRMKLVIAELEAIAAEADSKAVGFRVSNIIPDEAYDSDPYDYGAVSDYIGYALAHLEHDVLHHLNRITGRGDIGNLTPRTAAAP